MDSLMSSLTHSNVKFTYICSTYRTYICRSCLKNWIFFSFQEVSVSMDLISHFLTQIWKVRYHIFFLFWVIGSNWRKSLLPQESYYCLIKSAFVKWCSNDCLSNFWPNYVLLSSLKIFKLSAEQSANRSIKGTTLSRQICLKQD